VLKVGNIHVGEGHLGRFRPASSDHLKPSFGSRLLVFCMDISAVDSNDERCRRIAVVLRSWLIGSTSFKSSTVSP
jgi:hypothetical protein